MRGRHRRNHEKSALKLYLAYNVGWYHRTAEDKVDIHTAVEKCFERMN